MTNKKARLFIIVASFYSYTLFQCAAIKAQHIDTVLVHNSLSEYIFLSTIDTIDLDNNIKEYVLKVSIRNLETNNYIQELIDTSRYDWDISGISYFDINLDDFIDLEIRYHNRSRGNDDNSFWLYDSTQNLFIYSRDFSQLDEYEIINRNDKIIRVYESMYVGIICQTTYIYEIDGTQLILLEQAGCDEFRYEGFYDNYVYYKKKLINGKMRYVELDSLLHVKDMFIDKYYSFYQDTLVIKEVYWTNDNRANFTDSSNPEVYYTRARFGEVKLLKKDIYNYSVSSDGKLQVVIDKYIVENEELIKVQ